MTRRHSTSHLDVSHNDGETPPKVLSRKVHGYTPLIPKLRGPILIPLFAVHIHMQHVLYTCILLYIMFCVSTCIHTEQETLHTHLAHIDKPLENIRCQFGGRGISRRNIGLHFPGLPPGGFDTPEYRDGHGTHS